MGDENPPLNKTINIMSSCYISSGVQLGCSDGIGGINYIYILGGASGATVSGVTYDANDEITGATGNGTFYKFALKRNTSVLDQAVNKNFANGTIYYTPTLKVVFYYYQASLRDQVLLLAKNDNLQVIAVDRNGTQYMLGLTNGLYISAGTASSGTQFADRNGWEITFTGEEPLLAPIISGSLSSVFSGFTFA